MPRELPRCAAWSRRSGTTAYSRRRNLPLALSPRSSSELGVLVDHIEAHLDADRRELQDSITLDDFVGPTIARARVKIDKALVLLDDRVLPDRRRREVVEFLAAAILALGTRRDHFNDHDRFREDVVGAADGLASYDDTGYRTESEAITFASLTKGVHPVPRNACRNANATFIVIVAWAREAPVIIVMAPPAYSCFSG